MEEKKVYDLEARTEAFSLRVRDLCIYLKRDVEYLKKEKRKPISKSEGRKIV